MSVRLKDESIFQELPESTIQETLLKKLHHKYFDCPIEQPFNSIKLDQIAELEEDEAITRLIVRTVIGIDSLKKITPLFSAK